MTSFNKQIILFFLFICLFIGFLPTVNYYHKPQETSVEKLFNADLLASYRNYFFYRFFHRSLNNKSVIVGKQGNLYLGNKHNYLISKSQNLTPYSYRPLEKWTKNLKELQQWYEDQNIKFVIAIVPNKHTIYPEFLPNWVFVNQLNLTDRMILSAKNEAINILDLRPVFKERKKEREELLYYKTDSHWNGPGASLGLVSLINYLNQLYSINIYFPEYSFSSKETQGLGNARGLKINKSLPLGTEQIKFFKFKNKVKICRADIDKNTLNLQKCTFENNKTYGIHKGAHYFISPDALNNQKVLFLADSFVDTQTRLLNKIFKTRWQFHYSNLLNDQLKYFVAESKPDIVIYQVVERSLYNNKFIQR